MGFSIDHDALALSPDALALSGLASVIAVAFIGWTWRRVPLVAWGLAWIGLSVAPRFVFRTSEFLTEAHLYLPLVGLSVIGAVALSTCWTWTPRWTERTA